MKKVLILLSSYNGEAYLKDQLDSILKQTHTNWQMLIRDDGSTDTTKKIIQHYCNHDQRIKIIQDTYGNTGPQKSFALLLEQALKKNTKYIMLCDQDDVWLPKKIEQSLHKLLLLEKRHMSTTPILVHTDLQITNEHLA